MKTELNLKCRELILHRQQTTQAVYLASVTSRRSRRRSEFTVAPPTRTRYSHTQARDNVVLRIRQQAERTAAIAGRIVHIGAHTSESERKNWARKKRGRERKPTKVRVYRLMCIRDRARKKQGGTRRRPERDPLSYGHIRDFFELYLLAGRLEGKGSLLY